FYTVRYWTSLRVQLAQFGFLSGSAWIAIAILAPMLAINYGYHHFIMSLVDQPRDNFLMMLKDAGITKGGLILLICVFPAITEEIAFRGLIQHWLQTAVRPWRAIVLASAMFTVMHFSIVSAPYLFALGMLLGWAKWKSGSLYPSMLIHFVHNLVVVLFF